jgi:hypothetical protein
LHDRQAEGFLVFVEAARLIFSCKDFPNGATNVLTVRTYCRATFDLSPGMFKCGAYCGEVLAVNLHYASEYDSTLVS